jgi:hypothetical protein
MILTLVSQAMASPGAVLAWQYPPDQGQEHFTIYGAQMPTGTWRLLATVDATTRTFTDTSVVPGLRYRWVIRAGNAQGESPASPDITGTVPLGTMPLTCAGSMGLSDGVILLRCTQGSTP